MKKKQKFFFQTCIILFLGLLVGVFFSTSEHAIKATENNTIDQINSPDEEENNSQKKGESTNVDSKTVRLSSSDIVWTNWQKDSSFRLPTGNYFSSVSTEVPLSGSKYDTRVTRKYTIMLTELGDTIPEYQSRGVGEQYSQRDQMTNIIGVLPDYRIYSPTATITLGGKLSNWTNLPTAFTNFTGVFNIQEEEYNLSTGKPIDINASWELYSYYPDNIAPNLLDVNKRIRYKFDTGVNSTTTITQVFDYKNVKSVPPNHVIGVGISIYTVNPQVVKSQFRSLDEPAKELSPQEINGKNLAMRDNVSANAREVSDYEFDHYEYIDQKGNTSVSNDKTWNGTMDETKKMIVFWYKKRAANISLTKSVDKKEVSLNDRLTYSITMKNSGNGVLQGAKLTDTLPKGMSKPTAIKVDGVAISEGKSNANALGEYFTWTESTRQLIVYSSDLPSGGEKVLTYETTVLAGVDGEKKVNTAVLTGSNTPQAPSAEETVTVKQKQELTLNMKQEIIQKNEHLVVPSTSSLRLSNVKVNNTDDKKATYTMTVPSYEADTNQAFKKVTLESAEGYLGYMVEQMMPEFYEYKGYVLTEIEANHQSISRKPSKLPLLDYTSKTAYWLTIYIQPTVEKEGPPYYSWDTVQNDFGQLKW